MAARPFPFIHLSTDLLVLILKELDTRSLLRCKQVCRSLARIIDHSVYLNYNVELSLAGMKNCPGLQMPTAEKMERVRKYGEAWCNLAFTTVVDLHPHRDVQWMVSDGHVVACFHSNNRLRVNQFPSLLRGIEHKSWDIEGSEIDIQIMTCAVDSAQDLLVLAESIGEEPNRRTGNLHIRSMSTGSPHVLARSSVLVVPESAEKGRSMLHVRGDVVAWLLQQLVGLQWEGSCIKLWNWKTGHQVWSLSSSLPYDISSVAFLSDKYLMIPRGDKLFIHSYDTAATTTWSSSSSDYVCRLDFPYLAEHAVVDAIIVASRPTSGPAPMSSVHSAVPFVPSPDDSLVVAAFSVDNDPMESSADFAMLMPAAALCSFADSARRNPHTRRHLYWDEWGENNTHIVNTDWEWERIYEDVQCTVLGGRACFWDTEDGPLCLEVFDTNVLAVRRGRQYAPAPSKAPAEIRMTENGPVSLIPPPPFRPVQYTSESWAGGVYASNFFGNGKVEARLPCRISRKWLEPLTEEGSDSVLMMHDGIFFYNWIGIASMRAL